MADKAKLHCPIIQLFFFLVQLLKCQLCNVHSGIVVENNSWAQSIHQCWLQALQFLMHLNNLLSILLRYNVFTRIQKAVVEQTSSRPPFFGASLALGNTSELLLSPTTELFVASCCIKSTFRRMSQSDREMVHCCCIE